MNVGILALQGDFALHQARVHQLGARSMLVRKAEQLPALDALIIPGGESTTMLRLADSHLWEQLQQSIAAGLPVLATCAGLILLAKNVSNPAQKSFGLIDLDICRNAYGRQVDSFISPELNWTGAGRDFLEQLLAEEGRQAGTRMLEGVFIRAPKVTRVGADASVLVECGKEPVLIRQGNILGATFHPELAANAGVVHELLFAMTHSG